MATRRGASGGQAFVEMALGLFAFALALSAVFAFLHCTVRSLDILRTLRARAGTLASASSAVDDSALLPVTDSATVEVEPMAAEYFFGKERIVMRETAAFPPMGGME